jgi:hypothetical protein
MVFRLATHGLGGKDSIEPFAWPKEWITDGEFAHARGPGELWYPQLTGFSYVLELDTTFRRGPSTLSLWIGDPNDCNVHIPFDIGHDSKAPERIVYRIWNWLNEGRWCWGHAEGPVDERLQIRLLVKDLEV